MSPMLSWSLVVFHGMCQVVLSPHGNIKRFCRYIHKKVPREQTVLEFPVALPVMSNQECFRPIIGFFFQRSGEIS